MAVKLPERKKLFVIAARAAEVSTEYLLEEEE